MSCSCREWDWMRPRAPSNPNHPGKFLTKKKPNQRCAVNTTFGNFSIFFNQRVSHKMDNADPFAGFSLGLVFSGIVQFDEF